MRWVGKKRRTRTTGKSRVEKLYHESKRISQSSPCSSLPIILCSSTSRSAVCNMKTTGDESVKVLQPIRTHTQPNQPIKSQRTDQSSLGLCRRFPALRPVAWMSSLSRAWYRLHVSRLLFNIPIGFKDGAYFCYCAHVPCITQAMV